MPDYQGTDNGAGANAMPNVGVDPQWIQGLQDYLDGKPTSYDPRQGVPPGYKIDNGKVVADSNFWGATWPGLLGVAGMGALGSFLGPAESLITPTTQVAGFSPTTVAGAAEPTDLGVLGPSLGTPYSASAPLTSYGLGVPAVGPLPAGSTPSGLMALAGGGGGGALTSPLMKTLAGLGGLGLGQVAGHLTNQTPSQLTDLLNIATQRAQAQNPLFNAANTGTYTMLPNFAKTGPPKAVS